MIFYLSTPFSRFEKEIGFIKDNGFYPEIRMTDTDFIFDIDDSRLSRYRKLLDDHEMETFTHGPFFGLDIASLDRRISEFSRDCLIRGLEITSALGGEVMVMHTGYLPYFSRGGRRHWFRNWSERMPAVADEADRYGVRIVLENSWDDRPEILLHLADLIGGGRLGFCIDTGHVNRYSRLPMSKWWEALAPEVEALHLHDNDGRSDDHRAPGSGTFDFDELSLLLRSTGRLPRLDLEVDFDIAMSSREYLAGKFEKVKP